MIGIYYANLYKILELMSFKYIYIQLRLYTMKVWVYCLWIFLQLCMKIGFAISIYDSCGDTGQPCIEFLIGSRSVCSTAAHAGHAGEITSFRSVCFQYYIIVKVKNMIISMRYSIIILIFEISESMFHLKILNHIFVYISFNLFCFICDNFQT